MSTLNDQLLKYYKDYARIEDADMEEAQTVFGIVKKEIADNLNEKLRLQLPDFEAFIDTGSAKEGLKVVTPDEFDVMILYNLGQEDDYEWVMIPSDAENNHAPGYVFIHQSMNAIQLESVPLITLTNDQDNLSPARLRDYFHGAFEKIVNSSRSRLSNQNIQMSLRTQGPSMQIDVKFGLRAEKKMSIDFIPTMVIDDDWFVPKPYKTCQKPESQLQNISWQGDLWRWSYSRQEMNEISQFGGQGGQIGCDGHRKVLMIIKAIRLNHHSEFGIFSSYHYKTVLLHLLNERACPENWSDDKLADRFKDFLNALGNFLKMKRLPHYFDCSVNLLEGVSQTKLNHLQGYLERLEEKDFQLLLNTPE